MKSNIVGIAIFSVCFFWLAPSADAGFTSIYISPTAGSNIPEPYYEADAEAGTLDVQETWTVEHGTEYGFEVWGETTADPPLHIVKEVFNGTSMTWIGYKLDLDPGDPHTFELVSPAPFSDVFTLVSSGPYSLEFGLPSPLAPGETVTLDFVVNVDAVGGFSFTLTQMPIVIPEPSAFALALLGIGAATYRRRTRMRL